MDHDSPDPSSFEKLGRAFPKELRIAILICVGLALYVTQTEPKLWDWRLISALATAIIYLVYTFFSEKKPLPKKQIFWEELLKINSTYGDIETEQENKAWLSLGGAWINSGTDKSELEISESHAESFFCHIKMAKRRPRDGGGGFELIEELTAIYVSEVKPEELRARWWKGWTHRVGYYTKPDGTLYEWHTASVRRFFKNNKSPTAIDSQQRK